MLEFDILLNTLKQLSLLSLNLLTSSPFMSISPQRVPIFLRPNLLVVMMPKLVPIVLQPLPLIILPNKLLELVQLPEEHHTPAPVQEGGLEYPQVGLGFVIEECPGADWLAVEVPLRSFVELLGGQVRDVLAPGEDYGLVASAAALVGVVAVEEFDECVQG